MNSWWNSARTGLRDMEVREGDYLRNSEFGGLIQQLESAMLAYTDAEFKTICDAAWTGQVHEVEHPTLFEAVASFAEKASELTLSYAMSHPWLSATDDREADTQQILKAKKLAYLLCPARPRLRLVDLDSEGEINEPAAIANLKHYSALLPDYPMIFAIENARQTATLTLKLAVAGGAKLTYDETNTYRADGTTVNSPGRILECCQNDRSHFSAFQTENGRRCPLRSVRWIRQLRGNCRTPENAALYRRSATRKHTDCAFAARCPAESGISAQFLRQRHTEARLLTSPHNAKRTLIYIALSLPHEIASFAFGETGNITSNPCLRTISVSSKVSATPLKRATCVIETGKKPPGSFITL